MKLKKMYLKQIIQMKKFNFIIGDVKDTLKKKSQKIFLYYD